jgi:GGDEF domain-containing protein
MTADADPQAGAGSGGSSPHSENERLSDLYAHGILDGPSNAQLDRIVALAAEILGTPIALISLVDRDRQWFLSRHGLEARETPRDVAFCHHAIRSDQVFVVADALQDSRFHDNPLVQGDPKIRFYAGAPLIARSGLRLGTLCVIDRQPHLLTPYQEELLAQFSAMAMHEINHLRQARLCPLTAVFTRQALLAEGERVLKKARSQGHTPVLVTVALAGLRQLNAEADGATRVDERLERISAVCRSHAGTTGLVGRSGGGEFSLIWPDASAVEHQLSDLKRDLQAVAPPLQLRVVVTTAPAGATDPKLLLERAAAALR